MEETQDLQFSDENVGEDFYETIEAPKFVDFTVSDPYHPDDRYWFCSRVGCDQKHPEEMDSEAIYKNFVMRVMAARSPNVRLHRAWRNMKCPLTAPPKSSKSRVSRLALISSISKRIVDARVKSKPPLTKPSATPNVKPTQAHAKAMTTPRNRKLNSNTNTFLSVRNPKATLVEVPKTRTVAKALVFQSPKKDTNNKTSIEMNTPMQTLCAAMKKLEIASAKKNILGPGKPLPLDVSRKKLRGREVKSRVFDSLGTLYCKRQDSKSARVLKRRSKEKNLKSLHDHVPLEYVDEDVSDMDLDEKSRQVSMEGCSLSSSSKSNQRNPDEQLSKIVEPALNNDTDILSKNSEGDETSISNSEEKNSEGSKLGVRLGVEDEKNEECNHEAGMKSGATEMNISELMKSDEKENIASANKENAVASDDIENKTEITVNDENENVAPNDNREGNSYKQSERVTFGKHYNSINTAKVKGVLKKTAKENSTTFALSSHGLKSSRPKPTNPKPFRLRTDERGVLREANLEKKLNCPLKDITISERFRGEKLQKKNQCMNQSENCHNNCECENRAAEDDAQKMLESKIPDDGQKRNLITCQLEPGKKKATKKTEDVLKRTKLEKVQRKVRKPQRDVSSKKGIISPVRPRQLSGRKDTSTKVLSYKDATKPSKSCSRGRRAPTIPKEPNLHGSHLPKNCSRKLA